MKPIPLSAAGALGVAALGGATLALMDAVAKGLGAAFPISQVVLMRYVSAALWLALFIGLTRGAWPQRRYLARHALRSALLCLTAFLFFYGITHLPLAFATALAMSTPIYVALLGILVLGEKATPHIFAALAIGLVGAMVIIAGGDAPSATGEASPFAWAAALLAPFTYALIVILLKFHSANEPASAITLAQSALAAVFAVPFALPVFVMPDAGQWLEVALVGFLGALGFLLLISALRHLPASVFSLIDYAGLVWAAGLGYLIFGEVPGASLWLGGALIIAACVVGMRAARHGAAPDRT